LNAIVFLYGSVLQIELGELGEFLRANRPRRVPVVLSREEVRELLGLLDGTYKLMAQTLYGTGLRLLELLRLHSSAVILLRALLWPTIRVIRG
jgi:integrase